MKKTALELGFQPEYTEMTKDQSENLMFVIFGEMEGNLKDDIPDNEKPFALRVIEKRIDVMNLPIKLTPAAKLMSIILTDGNPGKMNVILIDCLTKFEGETITGDHICSKLYPMGFYSQKSCMLYIDNYLKTKLCKWSEVY